MTAFRTHPVPNGYFGPNPTRPFKASSIRYFKVMRDNPNAYKMERAIERSLREQAIRHENELRAMLGMWVSELTPELVVGPRGHWLGLAAAEQCIIGEKPLILVPISAVRAK